MTDGLQASEVGGPVAGEIEAGPGSTGGSYDAGGAEEVWPGGAEEEGEAGWGWILEALLDGGVDMAEGKPRPL